MAEPDRIVVDVVSPALFVGAGAGGSGVDTDVVTDAHGIPFLPRHRLAARLRAGAVSAVRAAPELAEAARAVFGTAGSHGPDRALRLGDAAPSEPVRAAVAWALARRPEAERAALRRAVTEAYTAMESGIEVDEYGVAVPGRLRTHRVLLPGPRLGARLRWARAPDEEQWRCLARACLAVTQSGLKASRGRGRVDVRLAGPGEEDPHATTLRLAGLGVREGRA
ncbi:hypothetical protein NI17_004040 [Thermobifida halotolerans]|uniref:CRISPR-associated protein n=1 Tax=Thermobifida halotolerans TaxID=483545 RepID=A0AA97LYY0_9ACTN|nr:hypothetical protein [Thermobifida halotolerans]UOE20415.1 hypothetical protein NI17_004040 [Thermobifida halotolerans]